MYASVLSFPARVFSDVDRLRRDLDDAFALAGAPSGIRSAAPGSQPAINVGHTPASVEIYAFLPGVDAAKVDVSLDRGVLTISGERLPGLPDATGSQAADHQVSVRSRERASGRFKRAVNLPDDADPERVQATYRDGVLHISVARRQAAPARRIVIQ